ncbi:MAG: glycoside hydrolase family 97 protein [Gemmatimonadetes bacterium]|nr:glycoside hydrolase family 97 protein [Gemmatimonadota bacterium]
MSGFDRISGDVRSAAQTAGLALALLLSSFAEAGAQGALSLSSPDERNVVTVGIVDGALVYAVERDQRKILLPSRLGFEFRNAVALADGLEIVSSEPHARDEVWEQPWGEMALVRDLHNELRVTARETAEPGREVAVVFRAYDDGIAFRYELPEQPGLGEFEIMDELTEFHLADDPRAWWIPANDPTHRYELLYRSSPASTIPEVHTPLTLETLDGPVIVIHEADLVDYAGMNLTGSWERRLSVTLPAWADGVKVRGRTPFVTPWRTIQMADRAADLVPSTLGLNLNPPNAIEDVSWIEPMKYVGIWWGMHINTVTWGSGPNHGATTENTTRMIDFAAENGFGGVLVEGWNVGWDGDWIANADLFSFTEPYPDFDLPALAAYANDRGVTLIGHNETSMGVTNYENQLDDAFALYESLGIRALKTGYVGDETAEGHAHHGQYMVRHWRRVIEAAARHGIMLNVHEPIKDTGERRTWPNMMTREGARGMEYNAWGREGGNPPEHHTILYFTRLISGPLDYTPGVFDILISSSDGAPREPEESRLRTTLAKQLALYVVLYSPLQMAADLPENYEGQPAFQFIRDVPVDWELSATLGGKIGDFVVVLRKDRDGPDWYLAAITDEEARSFDITLSFLPEGEDFVAEIYADGEGAHWLTNPLPVAISTQAVDAASTLTLQLAPGGGQAIRFRPAE